MNNNTWAESKETQSQTVIFLFHRQVSKLLLRSSNRLQNQNDVLFFGKEYFALKHCQSRYKYKN